MANSKEAFVTELNLDHIVLSRRFPSFQRPTVTGCFSLDSDRTYIGDTSQLKYVDFPDPSRDVEWDLNDKLDERIRKEEENEKLDNILKWSLQNKKIFHSIQTDIVCYRGLLTLILCTPYENQEGWIITATKWKGVIYLCQYPTEERIKQILERTPKDERFLAWGYKFEQYLSSAKAGVKPDVSQPNNEREEFCVMFKSKLNEHRILYGAEMDGVESKSPVNAVDDLRNAEFVELKTNRMLQFSKQHKNFKRYKLLKWWCQSYLVGIRTILCGFRDDNGIVRKVERMDVSQIHREAKGLWDPARCMNFCEAFLTFVKTTVQEDKPETVWKFVWEPKGNIKVFKVPGPSEYSFLHQSYADNID